MKIVVWARVAQRRRSFLHGGRAERLGRDRLPLRAERLVLEHRLVPENPARDAGTQLSVVGARAVGLGLAQVVQERAETDLEPCIELRGSLDDVEEVLLEWAGLARRAELVADDRAELKEWSRNFPSENFTQWANSIPVDNVNESRIDFRMRT